MVSQRKTFFNALAITATMMTLSFVSSVGAKSSARPLPPDIPENTKTITATGYCASDGGSIEYESISHVTLTPLPNSATYKLEVQVFIANPTGCGAGQPCPEYDDSPEYVNVWIDWNGDKTWDNSEKVMDLALTGYSNINYSGTMTAVTQFSKPTIVTEDPTWLRANLGWGYDPNNPCEMNWIWGNVVDQLEQFKLPKIKDITAKGIGTDGDNPQTGEPVQLEAELEVPTNYEITQCEWSGDLTPSPTTGDAANKCQGKYTPATGDGPKIATYGEKTVKLTITYKHKASGVTGQSSKQHQYKVFFDKKGDDDTNTRPNWYDYWGMNGAAPSLVGTAYGGGSYTGSDWAQYNGNVAAPVYTVFNYASMDCDVGNYTHNGFSIAIHARGIDCVEFALAHERSHYQVDSNWLAGGIWNGMADTDGDELPDTVENTMTGFDSSNNYSFPGYGVAGDDEEIYSDVQALGNTGVASNDWANPGKQTIPPYAFLYILPKVASIKNEHDTQLLARSRQETRADPINDGGTDAKFTGSYSDQGVDTDSDGKYNQLKIEIGLLVGDAGNYHIQGNLRDNQGHLISSEFSGFLPLGNQIVTLTFDTTLLRMLRTNGPYILSALWLTGKNELAYLTDIYTINSYNYNDFDVPLVELNQNYAETVTDTDEDGLYNLLQISIALKVQKAGTYLVVGELESSENIITVISKTVSLSTGSQSIDLDFDGRLIFQHRQDGPYYLRRLRVEDTSGNKIDFINEAYTTGAYTYTQFQHDNVSIDANSYRDQGVDIDNDGDFDYLRVKFDLMNVGQGGDYRVLADLNDSNGNTIESQELSVTLTTANPFTVTLDFLGSNIYQRGIDGPYQVSRVTLINAEGAVIDYQQDAHTTLAYSYTDFGAPLVSLTGNYQDYGQDISNDGLYDYLVIEIGVFPDNDGLIVATGRLVDSLGQEIEWVTNHVEMTGGSEQKIALAFNGKRIHAHGVDGPYELRDLLVYQTIDPNQSAYVSLAHTTNAYNYEDFPEGLLVTFTDDSFTATKGNGQVNLEWQTDTEPDSAGFFVWRGQLLLGKTECSRNPDNYVEVRRISTLLPAAGDEKSGYLYSYEDNQVTFGNIYCYALEDVQQRGKSNLHLEDIISISIE